MIKRIQEAKSLSSSSAFIIIIVLVVVSVAAIVIGGGDGFSRKYAGIDLREFSGKMLLAQTGVVGKILKFQENGDDTFTLDLLPIELDGSLLSGGEKYVASVVPPREGDTPFSYRPEEGLHVTQGYPILREYTEQHNITSAVANIEEVSQIQEENYELPDIPGMEVCNTASIDGHFDVFYEDIAYDTNVGFDDPLKGDTRRTEVCRALKEFEDILLLDDFGLKPGIVIQASTEKTPEHSLSVVSPQYVGGSGFVSTLLADYLRSGLKRSDTSFSDSVSVLGINSGFMRFNFEEDVDWSVDTGQTGDYDLSTVTRQNILRLLGFGSFLGHEQENILSSAWERWTEWDRLLLDSEYSSLIDPGSLKFGSENFDENDDFDPGDPDQYDSNILSNGGGVSVMGANIPDVFTIPSAQQNFYEIFVSSQFQKGQSLSGLANEDAVSYPILSKGQVKTVTQQEKEILCMLGLGVKGVEGCDEGPRAVAQDIYIERQNNKTVCVNIGRGSHSSVTDKFNLDGEIVETTGGVDMGNSEQFRMYSAPCNGSDFDSAEELDAFADNQTEDATEARSFSWTPSQSESLYRQYVQFAFSLTDNVTGRQTDQQIVSIHKCVVTATGNQLCNGDFQFSGATSSIDYKLSSLEGISVDGQTIIACQSSTMPGWCAQGVQDGFSSEFGYTWHPYLIKNPEAFDSDIEDTPRRYAGGSSGAIVQRLRVPLRADTSYLVTGKVYVTQNGLQPTFWYGSQDTVLRQPDGTYHVDYPEALAGGGERPVINEYVLSEPLTTGEWHSFSWTLDTGGEGVTHIAFGGSNNNGFILYDSLSVQAVGQCGNCLSDIDGDCVTNTTDLMALLDQYEGECPGQTVGCEGDLTFDGVVNTEDLLQFISQYGSECLVDDDAGGGSEICTDRIDNDGDGLIDRDDPECALDQSCEMAGTCETGPLCTDRIDNDGDGLIDANDPDCPQNPVEICDNGIDDDGDGKADIADTDCGGSGGVEICWDRKDNDGDGLIDSRDPDCAAPVEICNNGIDDDGDGKIDAADSECGRASPEICNNGIDDDGDGKIDQNDLDCGVPNGGGSSTGRTSAEPEPSGSSSSSNTSAIFLDEDGLVQDVSLKALLLDQEKIVPNSNGFSANYVVKIQNQGRSLQELNIVGALPSMLSYNGHVSTEENVAYDRNSNTIVIPSIGRGDIVEIYFNVDITSNVCAQIQRGVTVNTYNLLVALDLCDEYQEIQSKVYQTRLIEEDAGTGVGTSLLKSVRSTGGGFEISTSMCTDRIDNDGDGQIDKNDSDCVDTGGTSEFGDNDCSDGVDNDSDGFVDLKDPQCQYSQGTSESDSSVPECTDGTDNDSDGLVDYRDPDCRITDGEAESQVPNGGGGGRAVECADGIDNDGDGDKDMADSDCDDPSDGSESSSSSTECSDRIDNDNDKFTDYPDDPQCTTKNDNDETR